MRATENRDFPTSVDHALSMAMRGLETPDAIEGRRAFLEKRRPVWGVR
jgi:enoyl-CoA hydratase/carnithine racemase